MRKNPDATLCNGLCESCPSVGRQFPATCSLSHLQRMLSEVRGLRKALQRLGAATVGGGDRLPGAESKQRGALERQWHTLLWVHWWLWRVTRVARLAGAPPSCWDDTESPMRPPQMHPVVADQRQRRARRAQALCMDGGATVGTVTVIWSDAFADIVRNALMNFTGFLQRGACGAGFDVDVTPGTHASDAMLNAHRELLCWIGTAVASLQTMETRVQRARSHPHTHPYEEAYTQHVIDWAHCVLDAGR